MFIFKIILLPFLLIKKFLFDIMLGLPYIYFVGYIMIKKKITSGLEDYIEAISNYLDKHDKVRAIDIANELNVSRASVSEALKRLAERELINYGRYGAISITQKGQKAAQSVIKRHTLLTNFLCNILGLEEKEATDNACKIEHVISKKLIDRLDDFVNYNTKYPEFVEKFKNSLKK